MGNYHLDTFHPSGGNTLDIIPAQQLKWPFSTTEYLLPEFQREIHGIEALIIRVPVFCLKGTGFVTVSTSFP